MDWTILSSFSMKAMDLSVLLEESCMGIHLEEGLLGEAMLS